MDTVGLLGLPHAPLLQGVLTFGCRQKKSTSAKQNRLCTMLYMLRMLVASI